MLLNRWRAFGAAVLLACAAARPARAQDAPTAEPAEPAEKVYAFHFQATSVTQAHPSFSALYTGQNSLLPESEHETTVTTTLFAGARLWKGGELYVNPELTGGSGLSKTFGVAGFPNGEAFRVGSPEPHVFLARVMLRQTFALGAETETVEDDQNQLGGRRPVRRFSILVGKYSVTDFFDDNAYSHDPRTQFLNWSIWTAGAWDYPADTRGYTWGFVMEYADAGWAVRFAGAAEPLVANGLEFDKDLLAAHSLMAEGQKSYRLAGFDGTARLATFYNQARMGNYREAIDQGQALGQPPDITAVRRPRHTKWGFVLGFEQAVGPRTGLFLRGSWNDGKNEAWAYAEIERSVTSGVVQKEPITGRKLDEAGLAFAANVLSKDHEDYLAAGGYGFMIGDGRLSYGLEKIAELYYKAALLEHLFLTGDYQFVQNPAYNRDRGPVHVFGLRLHAEY
jgi:high affinity Mn2+ porin